MKVKELQRTTALPAQKYWNRQSKSVKVRIIRYCVSLTHSVNQTESERKKPWLELLFVLISNQLSRFVFIYTFPLESSKHKPSKGFCTIKKSKNLNIKHVTTEI